MGENQEATQHSDSERLNWLINNPKGGAFLFTMAREEPSVDIRRRRVRMTVDVAINGGWSDKAARKADNAPPIGQD